MIESQLGRLLLANSDGSPDQQDARPDEGGGYGALEDLIDRIVALRATEEA